MTNSDQEQRFLLMVIGYAFIMLGMVLEVLDIITTLLKETITTTLLFGAALIISGMILVLDSLRGLKLGDEEE